MSTVSPVRFRLLCREVASSVNARGSRGDATQDAVLLELLRRVERHLGRKPAALASGAPGSAENTREVLGRLVDTGAGAPWTAIAEAELIAKIVLRSDQPEAESDKEARRSRRA